MFMKKDVHCPFLKVCFEVSILFSDMTARVAFSNSGMWRRHSFVFFKSNQIHSFLVSGIKIWFCSIGEPSERSKFRDADAAALPQSWPAASSSSIATTYHAPNKQLFSPLGMAAEKLVNSSEVFIDFVNWMIILFKFIIFIIDECFSEWLIDWLGTNTLKYVFGFFPLI